MSGDRSGREREVFEAALERPAEERAAFLRSACDGDPELLSRVEHLLAAHEQAAFIATSVVQRNGLAAGESSRIGPYQIRERLGEGGMGVVYLAEQTRPLRRRVALKIIKAGMDTQEVIARFHAERQALALMSHTNIARILDTGATEQGRPYFVMEYVPGIPLHKYCDLHRLGIDERLGLFVRICEAVQHAHQKGVIHRDIKPNNVLVMEEDGKPAPKVIDFGIAKAMGPKLSELTLHTELGRLLGTPEYMSPEQADLTGLDVDTRADVYSLGAVLYELLVGAGPFELSEKGLPEIQRVIREVEPLAPSVRIKRLPELAASAASNRSTTPAGLRRHLRAELDWIVLTAMQKDRRRRYQTAAELADDVRRYLANEPVRASSPGVLYQARKFVQRHLVAVGTMTAVVLLLLALGGLHTLRLAQERDRANKEAERAQAEAAVAAQVTDFLVELFKVSDPGDGAGETVTAGELLDAGATRINTELKDQPEIQARLMRTMGRAYNRLGQFDRAEALFEEALDLRRGLYGEKHVAVGEIMSDLAWVREEKGDYESAKRLYLQLLDMRRELLGPRHPDVAMAETDLAVTLSILGDHEEAERLHLRALAVQIEHSGEEDLDVATTQSNLALLYSKTGKLDESEDLYRRALATRRKLLRPEHPYVVSLVGNLATALYRKGDYDAAEPLMREANELTRKVLGDDHPRVATGLTNLGVLLLKKQEYDEAEPLLREAVERTRKARGEHHTDVGICLNNLGQALLEKGGPEEAEPVFGEAIEILRSSLGDDHWTVGQARVHRGTSMKELGRFQEAEKEILAGRALLAAALGKDHERTRASNLRLIELYESWGKPDRATAIRGEQESGG